MCVSDKFGSISAHDLDKQAASSGEYRARFIKYLLSVPANTSHTVYVFASPHLLAMFPGVQNALLNCARKGTLRSVTLDEAHLFVKQGATFRPKIRMLGATFFQPLYKNKSPKKRPFLVCTTATNSKNDQGWLEEMTHVVFPPEHQCWASALDFRQQSIKMKKSQEWLLEANLHRNTASGQLR